MPTIRRDAEPVPVRQALAELHRFDDAQRFGQPSTYSLAPRHLAWHVRQLRRDGWQPWEIRVRFDTGEWAA